MFSCEIDSLNQQGKISHIRKQMGGQSNVSFVGTLTMVVALVFRPWYTRG